MTTLVLTVLGDDRPGIVDAVAGIVSTHGGSWERSRMAHLSGKFAGIVEVVVPDASADALAAALAAPLPAPLDGVQIVCERGDTAPDVDGHRFVLDLVGADQPGLVHAVSSALVAVGASIEELSTATREAPMAGEPLFEATATVLLPTTVPIADVRARLEALADHLMVDISLTH